MAVAGIAVGVKGSRDGNINMRAPSSVVWPEPTRITMRPTNMEIIVGESIVLPCQIACDPALDVSFSWAFNGQLIDFQRDSDHFERVGGVSHLKHYTLHSGYSRINWDILCDVQGYAPLPCRGLLRHQAEEFMPRLVHLKVSQWSVVDEEDIEIYQFYSIIWCAVKAQ